MKLQLLFLFLPIMVIFIGCDEPDHTKDIPQEKRAVTKDSTAIYDSTHRDHTSVAKDTTVPGSTMHGSTSEPGK